MLRRAGEQAAKLLLDFAFGLVGGIFDLGLEAFEEALEKGLRIDGLFAWLQLMRVGDVPCEVGEDDSPGEWVFPRSGAKTDVLALLSDPDAQDFEGGLITGCGWRDLEVFVGGHRRVT